MSGPTPYFTPSVLEIRELRRKDLPTYASVMAAGMGPLERATGLDRTSTEMMGSLRKPAIWFLFSILRAFGRTLRIYVAVEHSRVLGTASVLFFPNAGVIVGVATDPMARGQGIATRLMQAAHLAARDARRPWFALDVETNNATAMRVYRRLGYSEIADFRWFIGAVPTPLPTGSWAVTEVPNSAIRSVASWVDARRPASLREPLPANARRLTHLEALFRFPGTESTTWQLGTLSDLRGVVRAIYSPASRTVYALPAAWEPTLEPEALRSLVDAPIRWARSRGAERVVLAVSGAAASWDSALTPLGLKHEVSSTLMARPAAAP
ncbi:MAG: GNAT family N-acetyltransferase [Thermoplasmata archaeon]